MTRTTHTLRRRPALAGAAAAALLMLSLGASAQSTGTTGSTGGQATTPAATPTLDRADRRFMEKAATDGMAEVQIAEMAQQRAANPKVREFANRIVQDHGAANAELMRLATAKGMAVPADAGRENKREADRLAKLNGADFDRAYIKHMVEEHQEDLRDFERASKAARDSEVKAFATRTLPTLQSHLQLARSTEEALKDSR